MATVHQVLNEALSLLPTPAQWTKGALARDKKGNPVPPCTPDACKLSVDGAIITAARRLHADRWATYWLVRRRIHKPISLWNDSATYDEVVGTLQRITRTLAY